MSNLKIDLNKNFLNEADTIIEGGLVLSLSGVVNFTEITLDVILHIRTIDNSLEKMINRLILVGSITEYRPGVCRIPFEIDIHNISSLPPSMKYEGVDINYEIQAEAVTDSPLAFSLMNSQTICIQKNNVLNSFRFTSTLDISNPQSLFCCQQLRHLSCFVDIRPLSAYDLYINLSSCESFLQSPYTTIIARVYGVLKQSDSTIVSALVWKGIKSLNESLTLEDSIQINIPLFDCTLDGFDLSHDLKLDIQYSSNTICVKDLRETVYLKMNQ